MVKILLYNKNSLQKGVSKNIAKLKKLFFSKTLLFENLFFTAPKSSKEILPKEICE